MSGSHSKQTEHFSYSDIILESLVWPTFFFYKKLNLLSSFFNLSSTDYQGLFYLAMLSYCYLITLIIPPENVLPARSLLENSITTICLVWIMLAIEMDLCYQIIPYQHLTPYYVYFLSHYTFIPQFLSSCLSIIE